MSMRSSRGAAGDRSDDGRGGGHGAEPGPPAPGGWLRGLLPRRFRRRGEAPSGADRRELLTYGTAGSATVLAAGTRRREPGYTFRVRVRLPGLAPYEAQVRQRVSGAELDRMRPGDLVCCRVDPHDRDRMVLYPPGEADPGRAALAKILADGRRATATVLAVNPVEVDYCGCDDPVMRLDLELRAWDEPDPWHVRVVQPVPLSAIELLDLGAKLRVAFFAVDSGDSVAIDWEADPDCV
ncbi:hypothetical protein ACFWPH_10600 [Nocardia sp. NPDC058499]|uniref:hypothetical protein n=1 Tax=Nocardia sp. NPDC058499 TaxID=3346530 RepID=UPI003653C1FF